MEEPPEGGDGENCGIRGAMRSLQLCREKFAPCANPLLSTMQIMLISGARVLMSYDVIGQLRRQVDLLTGQVVGLRAIIAALPTEGVSLDDAEAHAEQMTKKLRGLDPYKNTIPDHARNTVKEILGNSADRD